MRVYIYRIISKDIESIPSLNIKILNKEENNYLRLMCQYVLYQSMYTNHNKEVGLLLDSFDLNKHIWFFWK